MLRTCQISSRRIAPMLRQATAAPAVEREMCEYYINRPMRDWYGKTYSGPTGGAESGGFAGGCFGVGFSGNHDAVPTSALCSIKCTVSGSDNAMYRLIYAT